MTEYIVGVMTWFVLTMIGISIMFVIVCLFMAIDNFIRGRKYRKDDKPRKRYI